MREFTTEVLESWDYCYHPASPLTGPVVVCRDGLEQYFEYLPHKIRLHFQARPSKWAIALTASSAKPGRIRAVKVNDAKKGTAIFRQFASVMAQAMAHLGVEPGQPVYMWVEIID